MTEQTGTAYHRFTACPFTSATNPSSLVGISAIATHQNASFYSQQANLNAGAPTGNGWVKPGFNTPVSPGFEGNGPQAGSNMAQGRATFENSEAWYQYVGAPNVNEVISWTFYGGPAGTIYEGKHCYYYTGTAGGANLHVNIDTIHMSSVYGGGYGTPANVPIQNYSDCTACMSTIIGGCTDPNACNYDPNATSGMGNTTTGTCEYQSCADLCGVPNGNNSTCTGCTDSNAFNYGSNMIIDDGSCDYGFYCKDTMPQKPGIAKKCTPGNQNNPGPFETLQDCKSSNLCEPLSADNYLEKDPVTPFTTDPQSKIVGGDNGCVDDGDCEEDAVCRDGFCEQGEKNISQPDDEIQRMQKLANIPIKK